MTAIPQTNVQEILRTQLIGAEVEPIVSSTTDGGLSAQHQFSWERVLEDPKGDHGTVEVRGSWYKTMKYEVLHSGGFLRLYTLRGRAYWNAQNETEHTTPDWKIHFSCNVNHIPAAWNAIAGLFMDMKCEIGMKATVLSPAEWSDGQRGREITVYIYCHHHSYEGYLQGVVPEHDHDLYLGTQLDDVYNSPFWYNFITEAERRLRVLGISTRGVADGDLGLPGCSFASLRNEAYVKVPDVVLQLQERNYATSVQTYATVNEINTSAAPITPTPTGAYGSTDGATMVLKYPPNQYGWNAARHPNPLLDVIFFLHVAAPLHARIEELEKDLSAF